MRSMTRAAIAVLALMTVTTSVARAQAAASQKIVYVNTQELLQAAPGRAEAEAQYQKETDGYRAELQKMNDSLTAMIQAYTKVEPTLTTAQKDARTKSIRAYQDAFQQKQQELQQQAGQRENELMAPIMEQVRKVLEDIRVEDGYAMILAGDPALILASDKNLDVTDRVVARLKTVAAVKPAAGATPTSPAGAPVTAPAGVTRPKPPTQ